MPTTKRRTREQQIEAVATRWLGVLTMRGLLPEGMGSEMFATLQAFGAELLPEKAQKTNEPLPMIAAQTKAALALFQRLYEAEYRRPPRMVKGDYLQIAALLKQYGPDVVMAQLHAFFSWDDPFVDRCGHTLVVFFRQWNRLTADLARRQALHVPPTPADCQHTPKCQSALDHSRKFLAENRPTPLRTT